MTEATTLRANGAAPFITAIEAACSRRGWSIAHALVEANLSGALVTHWRQGAWLPAREHVQKLADALDAPELLTLIEMREPLEPTWLSKRLEALSYPSLRAFALANDHNPSSIYSWARGEWRPRWSTVQALAPQLGATVSEVVENIWSERVGDACECGCGDPKELPQNPNAKSLDVRRVCPTCGDEKVYAGRTAHTSGCLACSRKHKPWLRVERTTFECVGYPDLDPRHTLRARRCRRTESLRPSDIRKRVDATRGEPHPTLGFIHEASQTYRCTPCGASVSGRRHRLREIRTVTSERIRSEEHLRALEVEYRELIYIDLKAAGRKSLPAARAVRAATPIKLTSAHREATTRGQLIRWWGKTESLPGSQIIRHCAVFECNLLLWTTVQSNTIMHRACYLATRKREGAARRAGVTLSLPRRRGRPCSDNHLRDFAWAIQYYVIGKSYRDIAIRDGSDPMNVKRQIDHIVGALPEPSMIPRAAGHAFELLMNAAS